MKIFPFVFLGLLLAQKKYRTILTAVAVAIVVTLISLRYLDPSIAVAWHGVQAGLASYEKARMITLIPESGQYDHSLFFFVKTMVSHLDHHSPRHLSVKLLDAYLAVAALSGVLVYIVRIQKLPLINQVLCLCVASILLTPVSYDYTLLHLYVPWGMLVFYAMARRDDPPAGLTAVFVLLAIATSVETELILHGISHGGTVKLVALCALFYVGLRYPFAEAEVADGSIRSSRPGVAGGASL